MGISDRRNGLPITCVPWDPEGEDEELNDLYMAAYDPYHELVATSVSREEAMQYVKEAWKVYNGSDMPPFELLRRSCRCFWKDKDLEH